MMEVRNLILRKIAEREKVKLMDWYNYIEKGKIKRMVLSVEDGEVYIKELEFEE